MPHETEAQHLDGQLREALKDRAAAIKQAQEAHAEAAALKAELHEARMQSIVDFGKLQKACEERDALKEEVERLRAALVQIANEPATMIWGEDWEASQAMNRMEATADAALQEKTDD